MRYGRASRGTGGHVAAVIDRWPARRKPRTASPQITHFDKRAAAHDLGHAKRRLHIRLLIGDPRGRCQRGCVAQTMLHAVWRRIGKWVLLVGALFALAYVLQELGRL